MKKLKGLAKVSSSYPIQKASGNQGTVYIFEDSSKLLRQGDPASNPIAGTEICSYGLRDLNQFYHIGTHNTAGETITPA